MCTLAVDDMSLSSKITVKFSFPLLFVVWLHLNFQVAFLASGAGFKSIKNKGVVMETQTHKKVLWLICTCMDSNSGFVAHTVPFL